MAPKLTDLSTHLHTSIHGGMVKLDAPALDKPRIFLILIFSIFFSHIRYFIYSRLRRVPCKHVVAGFDRLGYSSRLIYPSIIQSASQPTQTYRRDVCAPPALNYDELSYFFSVKESGQSRGLRGGLFLEWHTMQHYF